MAGFQKRGWGANKTASATPQGNKKTDKWDLNVKFALRGKKDGGREWMKFKLNGLKFEDMTLLNKINPNLFFIKQSDKNSSLWLYVLASNLDAFMQNIDQLQNVLRQTNKYTDKSIDALPEKFEQVIDTTPSVDDIASNEKSIASNWKELIKTMADPEVQKRFLAFQTSYYCALNNNLTDAMLSPSNVMAVLMADPQASFVTDKATWEKRYNRVVNPGAPFVIIHKVENKLPPSSELDTDPEVKKAGGWQKLVKDCGGPWYGAAWAAIKRYRKTHPKSITYYDAKVYDVRFTTPKDPNKDPFMQIANLVNNLTGELNDVAKKIATQAAIEKGEEQPQFDKPQQGLTSDNALEGYKNFILAKCRKANIQTNENGNTPDVIANAVFNYAFEHAERFNILAPKAKNLFASVVCYAIGATFNIDSARISSCVQMFRGLKDEDAESIVSASYELFKNLANYRFNEAIGDGHIMSFSEFEDLIFSQVPTAQDDMESVKNEFNEMLQRMNSLLK